MAKMTKEELNSMIAEQVKAAVASALETKAAPPAAHEEGDGSNASGTKGAPAAAAVERKYAGIYMATGSPEADPNPTKQEKGIGWARAVKAVSQSGGDPDKALHIAQKMYTDDTVLHRELKAMSATSPSEGGYFIPEIYSQEVIELLRPLTIIGSLGARTIFAPNGNVTIPKIKGGASAHYVGEKRKAPASKMTVGTKKLSVKKLITKVVVTNDLIRSNAYGADRVVLDDALAAMAERKNAAVLNGKGTEFEPLGILNTAGVQTFDVGAIPDSGITGTMMAKLLQKNVRDNGTLGFVLNGYLWEVLYNMVNSSGNYVYRASMDEGKLGKHPYFVSDAIVVGNDANVKTSLIFGRWSDLIIADQLDMETRLFDQGSVEDEDGLISTIDEDCSILRILSTHDFGVRHEESFVVAKNIYTKAE